MRKFGIFLLAVAFLFTANTLYGEENGLEQLINILRENKTITDTQYEQLMAAVSPMSEEKETPAKTVETTVVTRGALEVATYDGTGSFELKASLLADLAIYREDDAQLGNGTNLRKAKLGIGGQFLSDWEYEFSIDFADGDVDIDDAYIAYTGWWPMKLKVGHFKAPFGLEELTSSKNITFMERALVSELAPGRKIGVGLDYYANVWTGAVGVFGEDYNDDTDDEGDEGWNATGRLTFSPIHEDTAAAHFGLALSHEQVNDEKEIRFRTTPESDVTDLDYLDTGKIKDTNYVNRAGLELAGVWGPFSLQGEYVHLDVDRASGLDDLGFSGWYAYGSWFITGESRDYKFKHGDFGKVTPAMNYGALELAARYSVMDLTDEDVLGGKEENIALGLNWYINPKVRMMFNYIWADNDENADADGDVEGNDDPQIFQARVQMDL